MNKYEGLTTPEVQQRLKAGQVNISSANHEKSTARIIADNVFNLFNCLNFIIALSLLLVKAYSNLFFIFIIIVNIIISIAVEIKARQTLSHFSQVKEQCVSVYRDGRLVQLKAKEIVLDDCLHLQSGEMVPTDAVLLSDEIQVNEAVLTGEADNLVKQPGDTLLSGSYISAGEAIVKVLHVGDENYMDTLISQVNIYRRNHSELLSALQKVTRFTIRFVIPLGILLFFENFFLNHMVLNNSVIYAASALLGMLPKGLSLLIILNLTQKIITLAKQNVLIQDINSLESLARIDVLCIDKTGTLTDGTMRVDAIEVLSDEMDVMTLLHNYVQATPDNNATMQALRATIEPSPAPEPSSVIPFSSQRKWAALSYRDWGYSLVIGATDLIFPATLANDSNQRIIGFGRCTYFEDPQDFDPAHCLPLAIISLDEQLRTDAKRILQELTSQGVRVKILSGDRASTLEAIYQQLYPGAHLQVIDYSRSTPPSTDENTVSADIYARLKPEDKRDIIAALQAGGHKVAMVGDGVNDLLALKQADCSIALHDGSEITKRVANVILLDQGFSSFPNVMSSGKTVISAITLVAPVFFIKTIYSFFLTIFCALSWTVFPFIPLQITLIDLFIEGIPLFLLSFTAIAKPIKPDFLKTSLMSALPYAVLITFSILALHFLDLWIPLDQQLTANLMYLALILLSFAKLVDISRPLKSINLAILILSSIGLVAAIFILRHSLSFSLSSIPLRFYLIMGFSFLSLFLIKKRSSSQ